MDNEILIQGRPLSEYRKALETYRDYIVEKAKIVAEWDTGPDNGFDDDQNFALGNLWCDLDAIKDRFQTAIDSFTPSQAVGE